MGLEPDYCRLKAKVTDKGTGVFFWNNTLPLLSPQKFVQALEDVLQKYSDYKGTVVLNAPYTSQNKNIIPKKWYELVDVDNTPTIDTTIIRNEPWISYGSLKKDENHNYASEQTIIKMQNGSIIFKKKDNSSVYGEDVRKAELLAQDLMKYHNRELRKYNNLENKRL